MQLVSVLCIPVSTIPTCSLVSLALSCICETYYKLPDNGPNATSFVLEALAERSEVYSKKYGHVPCIFIDGMDLLAKGSYTQE